MKFSFKLVLCASVITAVLFSGGGYLMVRQNFDYALRASEQQNGYHHILERYAMESNLRNALLSGEVITDESIREYGSTLNHYLGEQTRQLGVFTPQGEAVFSNITAGLNPEDIQQALDIQSDKYLLKQTDGNAFMLLCSTLDMRTRQLSVLNLYDVTPLFEERDRQLGSLLLLDALVLTISVGALFLLSLYLTSPIKRMNAVSQKIAQGAYHERIVLRSADEVGQLAVSFNQMAQAVEERVDSLRLSLKQRDDFVASFSHELKTPMTAMIGYADILRTADVDPQTRLKYASYIYHEGKRLEELSHKLIELMSLSEEKLCLTPLKTEIFFSQLKKQLDGKLDVTLWIEAKSACVLGDRALLDCLLRNLIQNAAKASPAENRVAVTGTPAEDKYRVCVWDQGEGIPANELSRITEPFYMVDKSRARATGGSGLGLAICQRIAKAHGTQLQFESAPGKGTQVTFYLEVSHETEV